MPLLLHRILDFTIVHKLHEFQFMFSHLDPNSPPDQTSITDQAPPNQLQFRIPKFQLQTLASSGAHLASSELSLLTKTMVATQTPTALTTTTGSSSTRPSSTRI
ncbi:hypothetical protein Droror1_Dr00004389 [Drosera rotundifolia]